MPRLPLSLNYSKYHIDNNIFSDIAELKFVICSTTSYKFQVDTQNFMIHATRFSNLYNDQYLKEHSKKRYVSEIWL